MDDINLFFNLDVLTKTKISVKLVLRSNNN